MMKKRTVGYCPCSNVADCDTERGRRSMICKLDRTVWGSDFDESKAWFKHFVDGLVVAAYVAGCGGLTL